MKRRKTKTDEFIATESYFLFGLPAKGVMEYLLLHPGYHTSEEIAKETRFQVQHVNRVLYRMEEYRLVELYIPMERIETNRQYYWRTDRGRALNGLKYYYEKHLDAYNRLLNKYREADIHYSCNNTIFDFASASEFMFMCPDGTVMEECTFEKEKEAIEVKRDESSSKLEEIIRYMRYIRR